MAALCFIVLLVIIVIILMIYNYSIHKKVDTYSNLNQRVTSLNVLQDFMNTLGNNLTIDEKLESKNLQVVQSLESDDLYIMADGRRLWRVFDNLLNNICKYALCGTRVYINLKSENGKAIITFKNISEQPINMSGEELTERFVRGDRSRNTEGSGLGLSIAKSLTELQNGTLKIVTDADLFKVIITFDLIKE